MFIGHYGVALAVKRMTPRISLGWPFLAVQLLDVMFAILVLAGVEKLRIVHGFTAYNPYDLYFMPYTHSLVGSIGWSVAFGLLMAGIAPRGQKRMVATAMGLAVFSHFVLDVPVHTADMQAGAFAGFGEGRAGTVALPVRHARARTHRLRDRVVIYLRAFRPRTSGAKIGGTIFFAALFVLTIATAVFFRIHPSDRAFGIQALAGYLLLAGLAHLVDRKFELREAR
jgi:hypothetical protein